MSPRTHARQRTPAPVSDSLRRLGERVRRARGEAGLSQTQLGTPHFTRAYVSAIELGKIRPAMRSLEFIAAKLGRPVSFFLEDEEQELRRRERELDIASAASLLSRPTASEALQRILVLLEDTGHPTEILRLRLMAGTAYNFQGRGADALRELTVAERLSLQLGDLELQRSVTHQVAIALRNIGELQRSHDLLAGLLSAIERSGSGDMVFRMRLLKDLGAVSWDRGEYEKASAYYQSALEWAKDIGDIAGLISIYNGLAYSHRALGDLETATGYLQRALGATQVSNDLVTAAILHNALAVIAAERGHMDAAYRHVDRAIELARVTGPEAYVSHYLNTKAECALKAGRMDEASHTAQEALALAIRHDNSRAAAAAQIVLGEVARRSGQFDESRTQLEEAAARYRGVAANQELGDALMRLSGLAREQGDADGAQRYADEAYRATRAPSALIGEVK